MKPTHSTSRRRFLKSLGLGVTASTLPLPASALRRDRFGPGTRIPTLMISPYARRGYVDHQVADTTSILRLITTLFHLPPLTARDLAAYGLWDGLDFDQAPREPLFL